jgi:hypothetical protein
LRVKHRVIIRDDDTCGLTPVSCLETLYRPFLDRELPVTLATIPNVATDTKMPDGQLEGFIRNGRVLEESPKAVALGDHPELVEYLKSNPGFQIAHHGMTHEYFEFASTDVDELEVRLMGGMACFDQAGFPQPKAFVAPYDQYSVEALRVLANHFDVFSTGWFDRRNLPLSWLPGYVLKKLTRRRHWDAGGMKLLTHPGCLLSYQKDLGTMFETVQRAVRGGELTVLVTHWWEYFDGGEVNKPFIAELHKVARWLAEDPDVEVVSFEDL